MIQLREKKERKRVGLPFIKPSTHLSFSQQGHVDHSPRAKLLLLLLLLLQTHHDNPQHSACVDVHAEFYCTPATCPAPQSSSPSFNLLHHPTLTLPITLPKF
ncbi:hypothetical protein C0Q70_19170 [Pomacea canaliculata]|uniref:Uncharacterized protein n=1 Tax=Pomacea canaliculata TaxID=400727 RepID=A0A2T7NIL9_POMCA|nr:hypothetical protein C0Q70_19170 [Pomacea canaliculata]